MFVDFEEPKYSLEEENLLVSRHKPSLQYTLTDFTNYMNKVEFIISVLGEKEYRAAICNLKRPIGEEFQEMEVALLRDNIVVGSFAKEPIVIVKSIDVKEIRNDLEAALVYCSKAKYILSIGTGYTFQKDIQLGEVFISSSISLVTKLDDERNFLEEIFCTNINSVKNFYLSEKHIARYHCSNIISGIDTSDTNLQNSADKITINFQAIGGDIFANELVQLQKDRKISDFIVIKSVTKYADGSHYNNWDFTGAMAAFHYAKEKMEPYICKCKCHISGIYSGFLLWEGVIL